MMNERPKILIPSPTSFDPTYNARSWPEYAAAVEQSGGTPVRVDLNHSASELERMLDTAQGVLLPGSGADVDPARYGRAREPATAEPDFLRQATDFTLLAAAERTGTPLLAICFGTQILNVYRGGTLIQDLSPIPVNHRAGRAVAAAHGVSLQPEAGLAALLGDEAQSGAAIQFAVNSSHHQAIDLPGEGLKVVARSNEDGVVEAVEGTDRRWWLYGVQWHPERTMQQSPVSSKLFRAFINAVQAKAAL